MLAKLFQETQMSTQSIDEIKGKVKDLLRERTALTTAIGETSAEAIQALENWLKLIPDKTIPS